MSFIVVKYGKDQEKLFNTNCKVVNLLNCIKDSCGFKDCDIDLAEETSGILQFLPTNLHEQSSSLLTTPKAAFVLVKIQKAEDGSMEYIPMIDISKSNFLVKLRSTRAKGTIDTRAKRSTSEKKTKEDDITLSSTSSSYSLSASINGNPTPNNTTSNNNASSLVPSSSLSTSSNIPAAGPTATQNAIPANPNSGANTPTKGKSPAKSKKPLFPKIEGAIPAEGPSTPGLQSTSVAGPSAADESLQTPTPPPITPGSSSAKKRTHRKSGSQLESIA